MTHTMPHTTINPWTWQDALGYSQASWSTGRIEPCTYPGSARSDRTARPLHLGNITTQAEQAMTNVESVLTDAGLSLADVVRYDVYTSDLAGYLQSAHQHVVARFAQAGPFPAGGICAQCRLWRCPACSWRR